VYSNSTVGAAGHCFADVILHVKDLAVPYVSLDSSNCPHRFPHTLMQCTIFTGDTTEIKPIIITVNFITTGRLLNLQLRLTRLTGIST